MRLTQLASAFFTAVLITQLCYIQVSIPISQYSAGQVFNKVNKISSYSQTARPLPVQYVAKKPPYESLIFVGDVLLARNIEVLTKQYGNDYPYRGLDFSELSYQPAIIGNFESSVPITHQPTPAYMMSFSVSTALIPYLSRAGFTHMSLANNHTYDYKKAGYDNAKITLENNSITAFGHPNYLDNSAVEFIKIGAKNVAIIAIHTLHQIPTYTELKNVLNYAASKSDLQIAYIHWGDEYVSKHNSRQREVAERLVSAGIDLVIGHHPHVVQDVDLINGVPVFYSLGNYIFDQYDETATQEGLILQLKILPSQSELVIIPVTSVGTLSQPHLMKTEDHALFLENLASKSSTELKKQISNGVIKIGNPVASSAEVAIID